LKELIAFFEYPIEYWLCLSKQIGGVGNALPLFGKGRSPATLRPGKKEDVLIMAHR
jgi:hypothetical protein